MKIGFCNPDQMSDPFLELISDGDLHFTEHMLGVLGPALYARQGRSKAVKTLALLQDLHGTAFECADQCEHGTATAETFRCAVPTDGVSPRWYQRQITVTPVPMSDYYQRGLRSLAVALAGQSQKCNCF